LSSSILTKVVLLLTQCCLYVLLACRLAGTDCENRAAAKHINPSSEFRVSKKKKKKKKIKLQALVYDILPSAGKMPDQKRCHSDSVGVCVTSADYYHVFVATSLFLSRRTRVATKQVSCRNRCMLAATKLLIAKVLSWQAYFCRDKRKEHSLKRSRGVSDVP